MLESEREVVKEERRMRTDNSPTGTLIEAFFGAAYKAHNYRWPVVGWMKDLDAINLKDCQDFFNTHYNPKNVTVLIVGAIDHETAFKRVEHHFGAWQAQPRSEPTPQVEPELTSRREETVRFATNTPLLLGGWKVPAAKHEDIVALKLLGKILSDSASSRMYRIAGLRTRARSICGGRCADSGGQRPVLPLVGGTSERGHRPGRGGDAQGR